MHAIEQTQSLTEAVLKPSGHRRRSVVEWSLLAAIAGAAVFLFGDELKNVVGLGDAAPSVAASGSDRAPLVLPLTVLVLCIVALAWRLRVRQRDEGAERSSDPSASQVYTALFEKRQSLFLSMVQNIGALHEGDVKVCDLMSADPSFVPLDTTLAECEKLMTERQYRHLLVCDEHGMLQGVISNRDLTRSGARRAADLMTADPLTVRPDDKICPAITQMLQRRISCLPVVDGGRLVGVLTTTDLLLALQCALRALEKSTCNDSRRQSLAPQRMRA